MKCTDCGRVVKPVVAVDIDGTLADYHTHFLKFASAYLGYGRVLSDTYDGKGKFKDWFCRVYLDDEDGARRTWNDIKLAYRQGGMKRSMPPYKDAARLCEGIRDAGAELWLTTTRPYLRLDNVDPDTRFWLERHEIKYDGLLYDESKYAILAENIDKERVVAVLDDLPEMFDAASSAFGWKIPILRVTKFNKGTIPLERNDSMAFTLQEARVAIVKRITTWKETH